ncbi:MAG: hypothetical protein LEGION0403_FIIPPAGN_01964 [Legionella sp.]
MGFMIRCAILGLMSLLSLSLLAFFPPSLDKMCLNECTVEATNLCQTD